MTKTYDMKDVTVTITRDDGTVEEFTGIDEGRLHVDMGAGPSRSAMEYKRLVEGEYRPERDEFKVALRAAIIYRRELDAFKLRHGEQLPPGPDAPKGRVVGHMRARQYGGRYAQTRLKIMKERARHYGATDAEIQRALKWSRGLIDRGRETAIEMLFKQQDDDEREGFDVVERQVLAEEEVKTWPKQPLEFFGD